MPTTVFVVDDSRIIALTLAAVLTSSGYEAKPFLNPLEALATAETTPPDILISDVAMPEMSGIDLAIQFKAKFPSCRVLLFSGQAATANLLEKARIEGHDFEVLAKPIHPHDLLAILKPENP